VLLQQQHGRDTKQEDQLTHAFALPSGAQPQQYRNDVPLDFLAANMASFEDFLGALQPGDAAALLQVQPQQQSDFDWSQVPVSQDALDFSLLLPPSSTASSLMSPLGQDFFQPQLAMDELLASGSHHASAHSSSNFTNSPAEDHYHLLQSLGASATATATAAVSSSASSSSSSPPATTAMTGNSSGGETAVSGSRLLPGGRVEKRQRNTEAARRYRQRKLDRVSELEEALAAMTQERDDLRLKLARAETEADVLRSMVGGSAKKG
jgi:hypothetical protein